MSSRFTPIIPAVWTLAVVYVVGSFAYSAYQDWRFLIMVLVCTVLAIPVCMANDVRKRIKRGRRSAENRA